MNEKEFKPFIPANKVMPEFTVTAIIIGILLSIVFGGANAYLALLVGMTVSASIPAAVVSMGVIRKVLKRDSILENNMVQTIGSAGEALAGGAVFTIPVLFMWANEGLCDLPSILEIALITLCGGILGVTFMIPLRNALIVEEHGTLPYPEGTACAEVLMAGEEGGEKSSTVFKGLGIAALYKMLTSGFCIFPSEIDYAIPGYKGAGFGVDVLPALAGVGYICGTRIASYIFSGGLLTWVVIMPLIALFGSDLILYPATASVSEMLATGGTWGLWSSYIRYIGAGAVAAGGFISLIKTLPMIVRTLKQSLGSMGKSKGPVIRTTRDIPMPVVIAMTLVVLLVIWLVPAIPVDLFGAVLITIFGFMFAAVTSRIVGLVGSNNNPGSGMTIATLMVVCFLFRLTGNTGIGGMVAAITIGCVICTIIAVSGDSSQDLKTGYLVGATPMYQQIGEMIGCLVASLTVGGIIYLLNNAWSFGSAELPAAQATLMRMVIEGMLGGNLPWSLIIIGACIAIIVEILGIPVLPFGVGMYLPVHMSAGIMCGAVVRAIVEKRKYKSEQEQKNCVEYGVLYTSGLIAGEGVVGVLLALLAIIPVGAGTLADKINLSGIFNLGNIGSIVCFVLLLATVVKVTARGKKAVKETEAAE